jgi:type IV secretion system protein VirB5
MLFIAVISCALATPAAHSAMAVVDVRAITQLRNQIRALERQLETARQHLSQAQAEYQALTGNRGMELLLAGTVREYLPADWGMLKTALAAEIAAIVEANAVLTAQQTARLSVQERAQLEAARRSAAMLQVSTQQALAATSQRFAALQQLIDAIGAAQDPKAIMDLQARMSAEQLMLQNEHTKLQLLFQAAQAEEWARKQQARERAIADIGSLRNLPPVGLNN